MTATSRANFPKRVDSNNLKYLQVNKNNDNFLQSSANNIFLKDLYDQQFFLETYFSSEDSLLNATKKKVNKKSFFKKIISFFSKKPSWDERNNLDTSTLSIRKCIGEGIIIPHLLNSHCSPSSFNSCNDLYEECQLESCEIYKEGCQYISDASINKSKNVTDADDSCKKTNSSCENKVIETEGVGNDLIDKEETTQTIFPTVDKGIQAHFRNRSPIFGHNRLLDTFQQTKQNVALVSSTKSFKVKSRKFKSVNKGIQLLDEENYPRLKECGMKTRSMIKVEESSRMLEENSQKGITEAHRMGKKQYSMKINQTRNGLKTMDTRVTKNRLQQRADFQTCASKSTSCNITSSNCSIDDKSDLFTERKFLQYKHKDGAQKCQGTNVQNSTQISDRKNFKRSRNKKQRVKRQPKVEITSNPTIKDKKSCDKLFIPEFRNVTEVRDSKNEENKLIKYNNQKSTKQNKNIVSKMSSDVGSYLSAKEHKDCNSPSTDYSHLNKIKNKNYSVMEFIQPLNKKNETKIEPQYANLKSESFILQSSRLSERSSVYQKFEDQQHITEHERQPIVTQPDFISFNRPVIVTGQISWPANMLQNDVENENSNHQYSTDFLSENIEQCTSESNVLKEKSGKNAASTESSDFEKSCEDALTCQTDKTSEIENNYRNHLRELRSKFLQEFQESRDRINVRQNEDPKNFEENHEFHMLQNDAIFRTTKMGTFNSYLNISVKQFEALMSNGCVTLTRNTIQDRGNFLRSNANFHFEGLNSQKIDCIPLDSILNKTISSDSSSVSPSMISQNTPLCEEYNLSGAIRINNQPIRHIKPAEDNSKSISNKLNNKQKRTKNTKTPRHVRKGIENEQLENNKQESRFNTVPNINSFPASKRSSKIYKEALIINKIQSGEITGEETAEKSESSKLEPVHGVFSGNLSLQTQKK